jgi:hypothetical protein
MSRPFGLDHDRSLTFTGPDKGGVLGPGDAEQHTLAALTVTNGTYTWTWGSGPHPILSFSTPERRYLGTSCDTNPAKLHF